MRFHFFFFSWRILAHLGRPWPHWLIFRLGDHFVCLCRGVDFYEVKKEFFVIVFQKEKGNTFTLLIIFIVKSLQKGQISTNLLLWPLICRNKSAITPKWFNSLDTNSSSDSSGSSKPKADAISVFFWKIIKTPWSIGLTLFWHKMWFYRLT